MAITLLKQPDTYMPAYNPQWWIASSTQTAQANFSYYVTITDLITGEILIEAPPADPVNGDLEFNSGTFAERFIDQVNPSGLYGFQKNTGAIRTIRVNIGERYGATPVIYPGANTDYIVWNGVLNLEEEVDYDVNDFLYSRSNSNVRYLTNNTNLDWSFGQLLPTYASEQEETFEGRSNYIYCLSAGNYDFEQLEIRGYNSAGSLVSVSEINNPYAPGTTYTDKLVFVDIGYNGLINCPSGQVTGTYPIPVAQFDYYEIRDISLNLIGPAAQTVNVKRINVRCAPRFDVISGHYLAKKGEFETQHFAMMSERTSEVSKTSYSKYPYERVGNDIVSTYGKAVEKTISVSERNKISVATDYLSELGITRLKEMVSSPLVYMDDGDERGYMAMKVNTNTYKEAKKYNEPLTSVKFDLERTYTNARQRG